jgi:cytochrome b561
MKAFPPPRGVQIYNPGLRALHWLMAALIFVALPLGVWASLLPRGEQRSEVLLIHKSIGVTVLGLVALRIVWRIITGAPAYAEPLGRLTRAAARAGASRALCPDDRDAGQWLSDVDRGRKCGLVVRPVHPSASRGKDKFLDEAASWAHLVFAWVIAFVLAAHLGAVVWHAVIKRDSVLTRMWPSYRPASGTAKS